MTFPRFPRWWPPWTVPRLAWSGMKTPWGGWNCFPFGRRGPANLRGNVPGGGESRSTQSDPFSRRIPDATVQSYNTCTHFDILNLIHKRAAAMWPLAISTAAATCFTMLATSVVSVCGFGFQWYHTGCQQDMVLVARGCIAAALLWIRLIILTVGKSRHAKV